MQSRKKMIAMQQRSTAAFVLYYKALWTWRNFRKKHLGKKMIWSCVAEYRKNEPSKFPFGNSEVAQKREPPGSLFVS